jgi:tetratricopeptide (TPR) repeat protein
MNSEFIGLQARIRADAEESSAALSSLSSWMLESAKTYESRKAAGPSKKAARPHASGQTATIRGHPGGDSPKTHSGAETHSNNNTSPNKDAQGTNATADGHTYDKGYSKWEKFDAESALSEVDQSNAAPSMAAAVLPVASVPIRKAVTVTSGASDRSAVIAEAAKAREEGNAAYKKGDFRAAVQHYSRCVRLDASSPLGYSNRAMASIQLHEYKSAIDDTTLALRVEPTHVKSWMRRACARGSIGMHTAAARDAAVALALEPGNTAVLNELRKERDNMKACAKRAPQFPVQISVGKVEMGGVPTSLLDKAQEPVRLAPPSIPGRTSSGAIVASSRREAPAAAPIKQAVPPVEESDVRKGDAKADDSSLASPPADARAHARAALEATGPKSFPGAKASESVGGRSKMLTPISTSYELEKQWRSAKGNMEWRSVLVLCAVVPSNWSAMYRVAMDADLLLELHAAIQHAVTHPLAIIAAASGVIYDEASVYRRCIRALLGIFRTSQFPLTLSMLTHTDKNDIRSTIQHIQEAAVGDEATLAAAVDCLALLV